VYGLTDAMVGTFDLMRKVGMISKSEATMTATATITVKVSGRRSHDRCQAAWAKRCSGPAGVGVVSSS